MKRVLGYLKHFPKGRIVIDPDYQENSKHQATKYENWKEIVYPDAEEQLPNNMPMFYGRRLGSQSMWMPITLSTML
jgi:hypothetical protein